MNSFLLILWTAAAGFLCSVALTPIVARLGLAAGWLDFPDGGRKLHRTPVPALGGVAVFVGFVVGLVVLARFGVVNPSGRSVPLSFLVPLVLATMAVGLVGLLDDIRKVRPLTKLAVQMLAALYLYGNGFRIAVLSNPFGEPLVLGAWALPVTLLWLVGMSNAFNLIDGLDGLAAGLALVATLTMMVAAAINGQPAAAAVAGALAGALLGFLPYNFDPARVFLGDCGSLPVGFALGALALASSIKATAVIAVSVPLIALALPILDAGLAIVRRVVRRKPVFQGDHDHIHHRLVAQGLTPRRAVITLYAVATVFAALALTVASGNQAAAWAAGLIFLLVVGLGVRSLGYWEVTEFQRSLLARLAQGLRPAGGAALRGLQEELALAPTSDAAWELLCERSWAIGFTELHLVSLQGFGELYPDRHELAPSPPAPLPDADPLAGVVWSVGILKDGAPVARLSAHRPLDDVDFSAELFAELARSALAPRRAGTPSTALAQTVAPAIARSDL